MTATGRRCRRRQRDDGDVTPAAAERTNSGKKMTSSEREDRRQRGFEWEVLFDEDEEIVEVGGSVGSLVGFYGLAGYYIDAIGVYLKAYEEIIRVGTWGKNEPGTPQNVWSFQLEKKHHLKKITIDHGDLIYSLIFTTQCGDSTHTTAKFGGWNGGETVSEVIFEADEEITGISGTSALSRGSVPDLPIISSISFITNKKTHGPFGNVRGTPFPVPWDGGSFVGFYGLAGYYLDCIGVYLKA
ncbi:unnamed protein product [Lactuca virosa]|uniref:Jacalin-type lectin domain-containing protein n=1 Tax=Lactuca virosa TaxID=75947 RepID=A0AAU9MYW4_9ASTR|nr:unnamed protein product [Lactuca virosa]